MAFTTSSGQGAASGVSASRNSTKDTRGLIKIVVDADTGRILGLTAVAKDAGELAAAGVYILEGEMTLEQVSRSWAPYLTMAEGIKIAAQSFTTDVSKLSCCAV